MENINEEVNYMKYLFGYKKGVVISEQVVPTQQPQTQEVKKDTYCETYGKLLDGFEFVECSNNISKEKLKDVDSVREINDTNFNNLSNYYKNREAVGSRILLFNTTVNPGIPQFSVWNLYETQYFDVKSEDFRKTKTSTPGAAAEEYNHYALLLFNTSPKDYTKSILEFRPDSSASNSKAKYYVTGQGRYVDVSTAAGSAVTMNWRPTLFSKQQPKN